MPAAEVKYIFGNTDVLEYFNGPHFPAASSDAQLVKRYMSPMLESRSGTNIFFKNVDCKLGLLVVDNTFLLPTSVSTPLGCGDMMRASLPPSQEGRHHGFTNSATSAFVRFSGRGMGGTKSLQLNIFLSCLCRLLFSILSLVFCVTDFDNVVFINNFLLPTNLWPNFEELYSEDGLDNVFIQCLLLMKKAHPKRAVVFSSIDRLGPSLRIKKSLGRLNGRSVFSRQVHYQDAKDSKVWKKSSTRGDLSYSKSLIESKSYHFFELKISIDSLGNYVGKNGKVVSTKTLNMLLEQIVHLCEKLRLLKYSQQGKPQFSSTFIRKAMLENFLSLNLLVKGPDQGRVPKSASLVHGVFGLWTRGGVLATPLLGYDIALPQNAGLYRMLCLEIIQIGKKKQLLVNGGDGVGDFKRKRGAKSCTEYNVVCIHDSLPFYRRLPWIALEMITRSLIPRE